MPSVTNNPGMCSGCSSCGAASNDAQVQKLKAQIADWRDCPTTDSATKAHKVQNLQVQLDSVVSALEKKETGKGQNLDMSA